MSEHEAELVGLTLIKNLVDDDECEMILTDSIELIKSLEQKLEVAEGEISNIKVSLKNAYDHIQHEAYNDALSSILEAQHNIDGEE